jgi:hypothetical protein
MSCSRLGVLIMSVASLVSGCIGPVLGRVAMREPVSTSLQEAAAERIQLQVAQFHPDDWVQVVHPDGTAESGCVLDLQGDGFLFGPTGDTGRKISYGEVASVELDNPGTSRRFFDVLGRVTYHGAVWFGMWQIGGDTGATDLMRVFAASGLSFIAIPHYVPPLCVRGEDAAAAQQAAEPGEP